MDFILKRAYDLTENRIFTQKVRKLVNDKKLIDYYSVYKAMYTGYQNGNVDTGTGRVIKGKKIERTFSTNDGTCDRCGKTLLMSSDGLCHKCHALFDKEDLFNHLKEICFR